MKRNRYETIGIKQVIHHEWMQKAVNLVLAGLDARSVREELHTYLATRRGAGGRGERSERTRRFAVDNLMKIWVSSEQEIAAFRGDSLRFLRENPSWALPVSWGMISAAYPFWFNVARQTGRLLALQDRVTQAQIVHRLKEQYGDRQTISRTSQYVLRSFVAWGVIRDAEEKGCYQKAPPFPISDPILAILLLESALLASPHGRITLGELLHNPGLFPFHLPSISGELISQRCNRLDVVCSGPSDWLLQCKD